MKVTGPGSVTPATGKAGAKRAQAAGGFADLLRPGEVRGKPVVAPTAPASPVESLWALQEVPDPTKRRSAGLKRGQGLVDRLEELRMSLLTGFIEPGKLERLKTALAEERAQVDDPQLQSVLDEIEIRAAVEQAKWEVGRKV